MPPHREILFVVKLFEPLEQNAFPGHLSSFVGGNQLPEIWIDAAGLHQDMGTFRLESVFREWVLGSENRGDVLARLPDTLKRYAALAKRGDKSNLDELQIREGRIALLSA